MSDPNKPPFDDEDYQAHLAARERRREEFRHGLLGRTEFDEATIERLVRAFYARVRDDAELGPIFAARIGDWELHLKRLCEFWSTVVLMTGRYSGQPMQAHQPLPINERHFERWLELFEQTANEVCTPNGARHFVERAQRMAMALRSGMGLKT